MSDTSENSSSAIIDYIFWISRRTVGMISSSTCMAAPPELWMICSSL